VKRFFLVIGFLLTLLAGIGIALVVVALWRGDGGLASGDRIGVVEVTGFIGDPRHVEDALRALRGEDEIKAVVLRVNSPGGLIAPSQEIHDEVKRTAAVKPVVVSMGALAASGGYYVSAPATRIVANPGTATGSIGVILQFKEMHVLFDKLGLRSQTVKSGEMKDAGSPFREMTEADRATFQSLIDDLFGQFVDVVAEGRGLDREKVRDLADGRVYSGRQARDLGLVDQLGNFWDAVELAQELAGLTGEPKLDYRRKQQKGLLYWALGEDSSALAPLEAATAPAFRYAMPTW
jgi:protease-4